MATLLSSIRTDARATLKEVSASYWTDAELLVHIINGVRDLWGAVIDLHEEHFLTVDETNVTISADSTTISGVPTDTFRVHLIEPRDTTDAATTSRVLFQPRDYNSDEFIIARSMASQEPTNRLIINYAIVGAGSPVAAPTIYVAPKITAAMNLRFVYVPGLAALTAASNNPIPGESDHALIAWTIAQARAKEREDRSPDPAWLTVYATEKANILTRLQPRQSQEPIVVPDLFRFE